jgi:flagellar basal body-associated protein FliL
MNPGKAMRGRGISSILTAVIMALTIIAIVALIAISWPMIKQHSTRTTGVTQRAPTK